MNYAYEIRRQAEAAPRAALPAVTAALWRAHADGNLSEPEAEALSGLIEARQASETTRPVGQNLNSMGTADGTGSSSNLTGSPRKPVGSRPRTDASMARRRRWAASGRLPPALAARFTLAEQAVLSLIAAETVKRGDCRLAIGHLAAVAGVSKTTVRTALCEARRHGLVTIEERRLARYRNDTNMVQIVSAEWKAWLRLARTGELGAAPRPGGGCRFPQGTITPVSYPVNSEGRRGRKGCRVMESTNSGAAALGSSRSRRTGRGER